MTLPELHISDMRTFQGCRVRWDYSSNLRRGLQSHNPNKHLFLGQAIHYATAAYYGSAPRVKDCVGLLSAYGAFCDRELPPNPPEYLVKYTDMGRQVLDHYLMYSQRFDRFRTVVPEYTFHIEFLGFTFTGTIDALIQDDDGLWILESKSYTHMPTLETLALSLQGLMYTWAARHDESLGKPGPRVKGVLYNVLRKVAPTEPKVLKSGGLSKRANGLHSPGSYRRSLKMHDLDSADYEEYVAGLDWSKFFRRYRITYSERRMQAGLDHFRMLANEMLSAPVIYPADPMRACGYCDFRPLCEVRLYGGDWRPLAAVDYRKREVWVD